MRRIGHGPRTCVRRPTDRRTAQFQSRCKSIGTVVAVAVATGRRTWRWAPHRHPCGDRREARAHTRSAASRARSETANHLRLHVAPGAVNGKQKGCASPNVECATPFCSQAAAPGGKCAVLRILRPALKRSCAPCEPAMGTSSGSSKRRTWTSGRPLSAARATPDACKRLRMRRVSTGTRVNSGRAVMGASVPSTSRKSARRSGGSRRRTGAACVCPMEAPRSALRARSCFYSTSHAPPFHLCHSKGAKSDCMLKQRPMAASSRASGKY